MKVYSSIEEFQNVVRPIVTTGTFDGVHFGHRKIIDRLKQVAQNSDGEVVLLTFSPHPRMILFPDDQDLKLLNTIEEKKLLLQKAGIQHLIVHPFTKDFSRVSSINCVRDILVNKLKTHKLVIGYNHHFGRNREGSFKHLQQFAPIYGFEVEEIPEQLLDNVEISSTKIRKALFQGDVENAAKNAKNESPERYLAIGALRLLVKGKEDPETAKAFEKALEMNQWTERLKSVCAAQAGMVASGLQVDVLRDCDRIQQIENSIKLQKNGGVESGGTNGNGTDENATEDSEGLRPTGV